MKTILANKKLILIILISFMAGVLWGWKIWGGKDNSRDSVYLFSGNYGLPFFSVSGTYAVKDSLTGYDLSYIKDPSLGRLGHTVEVTCYKDLGICFESQGYIGPSSHTKVVASQLWDISQWSDSEILTQTKHADPCTDETLKIDRVGKVASVFSTVKSHVGDCSIIKSPYDVIYYIK